MHKIGWLVVVALIAVCVAAPGLAWADGVRLTNDPAASRDPYACSLGNAAGNVSVVWIDARAGTDRIYFTRVDTNGARLIAADVPVSDGAAAASMPSCGVDSAGATHIAWKQAGAVMYARLSSTGTVLTAPFVRVAAPVDYPHVDVEPAGAVHLAWVDTTAPRRVMYQKFTAGCGSRVYDTADTANTTEYPFVLAPGSGNSFAFVSWHGDTTTFEHLVNVTLPAPGCNDINGPFQQTNDIVVGRTVMTENLVSENAYLVFEGHTDSPLPHVYWVANAGIYAQIDAGTGPASHPGIAAIANTQIFTVWQDERYGRPWVFGQAYNGDTSAPVGTNCPISDGRSSARHPSIARAGAASFAIVWEDDRHGAGEIYVAINGPSCAGFEAVDPNPSLVSSGDVVTDPAALAGTAARPVSGLAADGVTPVLLRSKVTGAGTVTFDLFDEFGGSTDVGHLRRPGVNESVVSLTVPVQSVSGAFWGLALFVAPDQFVRNAGDDAKASRPVRVRATFQPTTGPSSFVERNLDVKRPPVLLLHGLWGKSSSWGWPLMGDARFTVYTHDYWQTNAAPFAVNVREARRGVAGALEKARDSGIAATQVDAFGHSMGGVLLRKHRASDFYLSDASFKAGDLHSLVTVDSPHRGSAWADVLLGATPLHPYMANLGLCVTCGAVNDLRPSSSEITSLPESMLPAHAFVGKGGSDLMQAGLLASAPRDVRAFLLVAQFFGLLPQDIFPANLHNDLIVGRPSQEGGLGTGSSQTSVFGFVSVVPLNMGIHVTVAREGQVDSRAVEVLNTPTDDGSVFAPAFPASGALTVESTAAKWTPPSRLLAGGIAITSPAAGSSVPPGVPIQVTVTPSGGFVPSRVLVTSSYDAKEVTSAPFVATLEVPPEAIGEMRLRAAAFNASNELATSAEIRVSVLPAATLTSIGVPLQRIYLFSPPDRTQLTVTGHFSDGVDRDVSLSSLGTTYAVSDPGVLEIDADGMITSRAVGITVVHVANGALKADAIVQVKPLPILLQVSRTALVWPATANAVGYDVVRGDLPILRGTQGSWELAIAECVANNVAGTQLAHTLSPGSGESFFYLVRAVLAGGPLSYDGYQFGATRQVGSRDAGIALAADACP
jgi:hypothetical protein